MAVTPALNYPHTRLTFREIEMSAAASREGFRPTAYIKDGCPFSFRFLLFVTEAGLLERFTVRRINQDDADFESTKAELSQKLGKSATFPTVEVEPGHFMADSDRLIERFAAQHNVLPDALPVLSFYMQTIFPQLIELHEIRNA